MSLAREWTAFAGAVFALMGGALAGGARRKADELLAWERERRSAVGAPEPAADPARRERLARAYRAGGLVFAAAGAVLLVCAATGRVPALERASRDALPSGAILTGCGLFLAANGLLRRGLSRAPRFLQGDPLAAEPSPAAGERVALFCARALVLILVAFGVRLLREGLR